MDISTALNQSVDSARMFDCRVCETRTDLDPAAVEEHLRIAHGMSPEEYYHKFMATVRVTLRTS